MDYTNSKIAIQGFIKFSALFRAFQSDIVSQRTSVTKLPFS